MGVFCRKFKIAIYDIFIEIPFRFTVIPAFKRIIKFRRRFFYGINLRLFDFAACDYFYRLIPHRYRIKRLRRIHRRQSNRFRNRSRKIIFRFAVKRPIIESIRFVVCLFYGICWNLFSFYIRTVINGNHRILRTIRRIKGYVVFCFFYLDKFRSQGKRASNFISLKIPLHVGRITFFIRNKPPVEDAIVRFRALQRRNKARFRQRCIRKSRRRKIRITRIRNSVLQSHVFCKNQRFRSGNKSKTSLHRYVERTFFQIFSQNSNKDRTVFIVACFHRNRCVNTTQIQGIVIASASGIACNAVLIISYNRTRRSTVYVDIIHNIAACVCACISCAVIIPTVKRARQQALSNVLNHERCIVRSVNNAPVANCQRIGNIRTFIIDRYRCFAFSIAVHRIFIDILAVNLPYAELIFYRGNGRKLTERRTRNHRKCIFQAFKRKRILRF